MQNENSQKSSQTTPGPALTHLAFHTNMCEFSVNTRVDKRGPPSSRCLKSSSDLGFVPHGRVNI